MLIPFGIITRLADWPHILGWKRNPLQPVCPSFTLLQLLDADDDPGTATDPRHRGTRVLKGPIYLYQYHHLSISNVKIPSRSIQQDYQTANPP